MCAKHGRGAIEICLSEKGALAKKRLGNTDVDPVKLSEVRGAFNCWLSGKNAETNLYPPTSCCCMKKAL